jgi:8-oxo-dGTP pyrophosphatase MutT (NUDIX family)
MEFNGFIRLLSDRLKGPLPGQEAQLKMSSNIRLRELMNFSTPEEAVPSSVLALLYPVDGKPWMVFIQRPTYEGVHSGQIAFPGGKAEPGDQGPAGTALRESYEEVGVDPAQVHLLGRLTDLYIPPSNFIVSPFVGYCRERPSFVTDPSEVERIVEVPFRMILSDKCIEVKKFVVRNDLEIEAPAFVVMGNVIWGATAMILSELRELLRN